RARRPPGSPPLPYTTLFRSEVDAGRRAWGGGRAFRQSAYFNRSARRSRGAAGLFSRRGPPAAEGLRSPSGGGAGEKAVRQLHPRSEEHTSELQSREKRVCRR